MTNPTPEQALADMLSEAAYMGYRLTLGSVPPWMAAIGRRMREIQVGDLVQEISTYPHGHAPKLAASMRIGHLRCICQEPIAMEWDEQQDGPKPSETVYYIDGLDGAERRWTNASFVAIPAEAWEKQVVVDEEEIRRFQAGAR